MRVSEGPSTAGCVLPQVIMSDFLPPDKWWKMRKNLFRKLA